MDINYIVLKFSKSKIKNKKIIRTEMIHPYNYEKLTNEQLIMSAVFSIKMLGDKIGLEKALEKTTAGLYNTWRKNADI